MVPALCQTTAAVPPPADTRALAKQPPALHLNAVTVVQSLHLLTLCRLAVQLAQRRCPPPLPKGPGGAPRTYTEESLLLIALLRTLWRLSYQDMHDWLVAWPALAVACGLPVHPHGRVRVPSAAQMCKRAQRAGAPTCEMLFIVAVREALRCGLIGAKDLIIDSAPILAWHRADPDASVGHAPAQHPTRCLHGFRVHTVLCRGSGLPLLFGAQPGPSARCPLCPTLAHLGRPPLRPAPARRAPGRWPRGDRPHPLDTHRARGRRRDPHRTPSALRTAPACPLPGPKASWANAAVLSASLAASSSSSTSSVLPSPAGRQWPRASP